MKYAKRIGLHLFFWAIAAVFLFSYLNTRPGHSGFVFLFVGTLLPITAAATYTLNYYLIPRYLFKGRHLPFGLYTALLLVGALYLETLVLVLVFATMADYEIQQLPPMSTNIMHLGVGTYFIIFVNAVAYVARKRMAAPPPTPLEETPQPPSIAYLHVRANRQNLRLHVPDIYYIESMDNYVQLHLAQETIITKEKISHLAEKLPDGFLRIHRSYLVNQQRISAFTKESVTVKDEPLPISRTYKTAVQEALQGKPQE